jgi:hypothetical protein
MYAHHSELATGCGRTLCKLTILGRVQPMQLLPGTSDQPRDAELGEDVLSTSNEVLVKNKDFVLKSRGQGDNATKH